eukprot:CAMPEP_0206002158 /NCGR_PEP_ID=MMETSP1464-20131121/2569_1 /ASSEMBLY_ACC=CAM_ASM_001124 /TAXON_ID=119497 /ORGANISM="Exanthemachrysis gayraliae, Strain RCC1523" /LENGTH=217 /DNA_ID=CAMNT_0053375495 /DNA_START=22 /DNA_END=674 /DNA_ORIENTATION=-
MTAAPGRAQAADSWAPGRRPAATLTRRRSNESAASAPGIGAAPGRCISLPRASERCRADTPGRPLHEASHFNHRHENRQLVPYHPRAPLAARGPAPFAARARPRPQRASPGRGAGWQREGPPGPGRQQRAHREPLSGAHRARIPRPRGSEDPRAFSREPRPSRPLPRARQAALPSAPLEAGGEARVGLAQGPRGVGDPARVEGQGGALAERAVAVSV